MSSFQVSVNLHRHAFVVRSFFSSSSYLQHDSLLAALSSDSDGSHLSSFFISNLICAYVTVQIFIIAKHLCEQGELLHMRCHNVMSLLRSRPVSHVLRCCFGFFFSYSITTANSTSTLISFLTIYYIYVQYPQYYAALGYMKSNLCKQR